MNGLVLQYSFFVFPENAAPTSVPSSVDPNTKKRNLELETFLLAFLTAKVRASSDGDNPNIYVINLCAQNILKPIF